MIKKADGIRIANQLALKRGGKCLSVKYKNMHTKLLWECSSGHIWERALTYIKHRKQWCPQCCKRPPLSIKDCINAAEKKNGKCISTKYINCEEKLLWECSKGHRWTAIFRSIRLNKSWCPKCKHSKTQNKLMEILENILGDKAISDYKDFKWLYNPKTKRKLEIDIWFPDIKLAVEYDGRQHFVPVECFGGQSEFEKIIERDAIKNKLISSSDDISYFIRISYKDKLSSRDIKNKLMGAGIQC